MKREKERESQREWEREREEGKLCIKKCNGKSFGLIIILLDAFCVEREKWRKEGEGGWDEKRKFSSRVRIYLTLRHFLVVVIRNDTKIAVLIDQKRELNFSVENVHRQAKSGCIDKDQVV